VAVGKDLMFAVGLRPVSRTFIQKALSSLEKT